MELIPGKIYRDTSVCRNDSTYLEFIGYDEEAKAADFDFVGGSKTYTKTDGVISFGYDEILYEPTAEELASLNLNQP